MDVIQTIVHADVSRAVPSCKRPPILSYLIGQRKCHHFEDTDIEPERTGKTSDPQQITGRSGDDTGGSKKAPHEAITGQLSLQPHEIGGKLEWIRRNVRG